MKFLVALLGRRALKRWMNRKSPKADLVGGSAVAMLITGGLSLVVEPEVAAVLGANLGALGTTLVNLWCGDDVAEGSSDEPAS